MPTDPAIRDHQAWLGYLQPDGLVVSPAALVDAQVILDTRAIETQQRFGPHVQTIERDDDEILAIPDFAALCREFLGWPSDCLWGLDAERPLPDDLRVPLPELGETLEPTFAFRDPKPKDPGQPWLLLAQMLTPDAKPADQLDKDTTGAEASWTASPSRRFERLLRETKVPVGLLTNGTNIRLMYAPRGENSGNVTFPVAAMTEVAGRPVLAALYELLQTYRLLAAPSEARLPALLQRSREYQSSVSTALAQQVLAALYELLRGFQAADERTKGELLREILAKHPDDVYGGLLTVLLRLVFLLYAEDRGLMPGSSLYVQNYSIHGLFERLRRDHEHYPDTMDHRFGGWAQLLALFRAVCHGCANSQMRMPARSGYLFDPRRFPFLEGATEADNRIPLVSDGVLYRVLSNLLLLDGERLSYRTLDVEQIGSVYETMMGFKLRIAAGMSIALKPPKPHGAPTPVNLEVLLGVKPTERAKWLREQADAKLTDKVAAAIKAADSLDGLLAALESRIARTATPHPVAKVGLLLMPTDERRRSGSHYTPRSLTEPIVRKTLEPILKRLGERPTPEQLLDLKICDPAMGSGAFLVEACRQLGDELVKAWHVHNCVPKIPPDEDELLHARRVIAQRCLYGVDKNPMAVDLAKLSLWLATLAKDHPFTFLDHALRAGDSLVGLTRQQIADFHWQRTTERRLGQEHIAERIERATKARKEILDAGDTLRPEEKAQKLAVADEALDAVRFFGDLCVAAFFAGEKDKARKSIRDDYLDALAEYLRGGDMRKRPTEEVQALRAAAYPIEPFHWEIEFPEVFVREGSGFDAFIGNPPFAGRTTLSEGSHPAYIDWLKVHHEESHGNADLVAHFFRRSFALLRRMGCFGLIATNTIGQGDTRATGLRWICTHGGTIFCARRRLKWPGQAAVVVSVVHVTRGPMSGPFELDGRAVPIITAYLFHAGGHESPLALVQNEGKSFQGCVVVGMGFTFDDSDSNGVASSTAAMHELIRRNPRNAERIFPYIGGEEISTDPRQSHHRFVINFGDASEHDARNNWPDLMAVVEQRVKPERTKRTSSWSLDKQKRAEKWWQFSRTAKELFTAIDGLERVLAISRVGNAFAFCFLKSRMVYSERLVVFPFDSFAAFCALQCRTHETWVRCFSSTLKDDLMYVSSDCFDNYPFPESFLTARNIHVAGQAYYEFRAALMVRNNEGLTKTYNRFHDPNETSPDIARLRELHAEMDRAVLDAYGWTDIPTDCQFLLDYEDDEDEDDEGFSLSAALTSRNARTRKKPWRYRWPDEIRDEVLARLLALNAKRAEQERLSGAAAEAKTVVTKPKKVAAARGVAAEVSLFESAYPATGSDRAICAVSLAMVEQTRDLTSMDHLDASLLATHPNWCKAFLSATRRKNLDQALKKAPAELFVGDDGAIRWKECRDYLEKRKAVQVDRTASNQLIAGGAQLSTVKAEFPAKVHEIVALALEALRELQKLREDATRATKEQRAILSTLTQQAQNVGLAVA